MAGRRYGRFRVTRAQIDDNLGKIIYKDLVPLEVRYAFDFDGFEVLAIGDQFEPVERGCEAPRYEVRIEFDTVPSTPEMPVGRTINHHAVFVKAS